MQRAERLAREAPASRRREGGATEDSRAAPDASLAQASATEATCTARAGATEKTPGTPIGGLSKPGHRICVLRSTLCV
eukprot:2771170-Pyramimonas_sp.AAC.1